MTRLKMWKRKRNEWKRIFVKYQVKKAIILNGLNASLERVGCTTEWYTQTCRDGWIFLVSSPSRCRSLFCCFSPRKIPTIMTITARRRALTHLSITSTETTIMRRTSSSKSRRTCRWQSTTSSTTSASRSRRKCSSTSTRTVASGSTRRTCRS